MSAKADSNSEADLFNLLASMSRQVDEMPPRCRPAAAFMLRHYGEQRELPTVRVLARATHSSQGMAERNRETALAIWRRALAREIGL